MANPTTLVQHPVPVYVKDESGRVQAAYMRVRTDKAVRAVRPRPDAQVYFYLGADDRIVGIHMLENRPGVALEAVRTLLDANGVGEKVHHAYLTFEECIQRLREILNALEGMSKQLPAPEPACT